MQKKSFLDVTFPFFPYLKIESRILKDIFDLHYPCYENDQYNKASKYSARLFFRDNHASPKTAFRFN